MIAKVQCRTIMYYQVFIICMQHPPVEAESSDGVSARKLRRLLTSYNRT